MDETETVKEIFKTINFTYDPSSKKIQSKLTQQEITLSSGFEKYLNSLRPGDATTILNSIKDKVAQLNDKNSALVEIIKNTKASINDSETSENLDSMLKELQSLELKIVLYICQQTKQTHNTELIQQIINAVKPKLESLNAFYDQKIGQVGGNLFSAYINNLYKGIKYKGKYIMTTLQ